MRTGVCFATSVPTIAIDSMTFAKTSVTLDADTEETIDVRLNTNPGQANSPTITYASNDTTVATVSKLNDKEIRITAKGAGTATITATAGEGGSAITATISVTCTTATPAEPTTNVNDNRNTKTTAKSSKPSDTVTVVEEVEK